MKKLTVCLILVLLLAAAFAVSANAAEIVASGTCGADGDNLTWTLDDEGTLVISGTGPMKDYSDYGSIPWYFCCASIKNAVVNDGVTSIGIRAFSDCSSLSGIVIPDSVTSIGIFAFSNCSGLTGAAIPGSVTRIGGHAFYNCSGLTSITIPGSVTSIGDYVFSECRGLKRIDAAENNPNYCSAAGILYNKTMSELIAYPGGITGGFVLPDSVTSIGVSAFSDCGGLTGITIPCGVTSISDSAFSRCSGLTGVTIPGSVTSIGDFAFSSCGSLTSVTIGNSVTGIGAYAFYCCSGLTGITIPDSVTSIGACAFSFCRSLTGITIPDGMTSIGDYAFSCFSGLTSITIPDGVTSIGDSAFNGCSSLTSITIGNGVTSISRNAFYGCSSLSAVIVDPTNVRYKDIDGVLFDQAETELITFPAGKKGAYVIPDGVTDIGSGAFYDCDNLTQITVPKSLEFIWDHAFANCDALEWVFYAGSAEQWNAIDIDFINEPLYNARILIGALDFYHGVCGKNMSYVYDPEIQTLTISGTGRMWDYYDYDEEDAAIASPWYPQRASIKNVVLGDGVTSIGACAFTGCTGLRAVYLPRSVKSIGEKAFYDCEKLCDVYYSGSETDWSAMEIGSGNGFLTAADVHYGENPIGAAKADVVGVTSARVDGKTVYTVTVYCMPGADAWAYGVRYGANGQMLGLVSLHLAPGQDNELTVTAEDGTFVRIFAVDGKSAAPLCATVNLGAVNR